MKRKSWIMFIIYTIDQRLGFRKFNYPLKLFSENKDFVKNIDEMLIFYYCTNYFDK